MLNSGRSQHCDDSATTRSVCRRDADTRRSDALGMRKQNPESSERIAPLLPISLCIEKAASFSNRCQHRAYFLTISFSLHAVRSGPVR